MLKVSTARVPTGKETPSLCLSYHFQRLRRAGRPTCIGTSNRTGDSFCNSKIQYRGLPKTGKSCASHKKRKMGENKGRSHRASPVHWDFGRLGGLAGPACGKRGSHRIRRVFSESKGARGEKVGEQKMEGKTASDSSVRVKPDSSKKRASTVTSGGA